MEYRLGDIVDDYCSRCRMISNNSVEALVGGEVVKVCCRTCNYSHEYKNGKLPEKVKPRKTSTKSAFDAVLASVMAGKNLKSDEAKPAATRREDVAHHRLHTLASARKSQSK